MKPLLLLALLTILNLSSYGKELKIKFGKIDKSDLEMTVYEQDSSAAAVILYEKGDSKIDYNETHGWQLVFNKHVRIKILKKEGVEFADFSIGLHKNSSNREETSGIKAVSFNLEDGKIVKDELSKKEIHYEEVNKYYNRVSFSLPNVKVGSVIDVKYSINCKAFFRNMRPWYFQHSIPTIYSEYRVRIPEYFNFSKFSLGFEDFTVAEENQVPGSVTLMYKSRSGGNGMSVQQTSFHQETVRFLEKDYHWIAEDMPAFEEEAYVSTSDNYIQQIQFELESIKFPNSDYHSYSESWSSINNNLKSDDDFGAVIFGNAKFLEDETAQLLSGIDDNHEKVEVLFKHVRDNYKYNDLHSIYSKSLRKVYKDKNGNVADLNFLLAGYLKNAGFDVRPVVLSTRANGIFIYPTVTGFNYVVLACNVDGKRILLDVASENTGINEIPFKCLNGKGMIVGGAEPEWIELLEIGQSRFQCASSLQVSEEGHLSGKVNKLRTGYSAQAFKAKVNGYDTLDKYLEEQENENVGDEIISHEIEGIDGLDSRVVEKMEVVLKGKSIFAGDKIFVNPIIFNKTEDNPFKLKERKYPVDFGFKFSEIESVQLTIPEGYEVEEVPETIKVGLPNGEAAFMFSCTKIGDKMINIIAKFSISKSVFYSNDYEALKTVFNRLIEKENEQIVLKKI